MKNKIGNKKGFTLIELLVVVLIIGILAAIALPQYEKAVEKSRLVEMMQNIKVFKNNVQLYVLENGYPSSPTKLKDLDFSIDFQGGDWDGNDDYVTQLFVYSCALNPTGGYCEIYRHNGNMDIGAYAVIEVPTEKRWRHICYTWGSPLGTSMCKQLEKQGWETVDGEL